MLRSTIVSENISVISQIIVE